MQVMQVDLQKLKIRLIPALDMPEPHPDALVMYFLIKMIEERDELIRKQDAQAVDMKYKIEGLQEQLARLARHERDTGFCRSGI
jgi:hypothetical protein